MRKPTRKARATVLVALLLLLCLLAAGAPLYHNSVLLSKWSVMLNVHADAFLLWRAVILVLFFTTWPCFVRWKNQGRVLSKAQYQQLIALRYPLVLSLLMLDALLQGIF